MSDEPKRILLIAMRLDEMRRIHPDMIVCECDRCHRPVGVYPSGQSVLRANPDTELVCNICHPPDANAHLAPGAEMEPFQSRRK